jgi:hypothetical protein
VLFPERGPLLLRARDRLATIVDERLTAAIERPARVGAGCALQPGEEQRDTHHQQRYLPGTT